MKFWIIITVTLQFKQREIGDEIIKLKWMLWLVCAYLGVALQGHVREGLSDQRVTLGFELILLISFSFLLGVCCCLAENRFLLGERNIPSKTKIRKLANHAKNNLFLPKTTVYGRKNILRVFAQLTNVTFQLIWRLEFSSFLNFAMKFCDRKVLAFCYVLLQTVIVCNVLYMLGKLVWFIINSDCL